MSKQIERLFTYDPYSEDMIKLSKKEIKFILALNRFYSKNRTKLTDEILKPEERFDLWMRLLSSFALFKVEAKDFDLLK